MKNLKFIILGLAACILWVVGSSSLITILKGPYYPLIPSPIFEKFILFIWAPIWEELCFRWAPMKIAKETDEKKFLLPLIIISSVFFGMGHGKTLQEGILVEGVAGAILCGIYLKTKKIWVNMVIHSLFNIFCSF